MLRIIILAIVFLGLGSLTIWTIQNKSKVSDSFVESLHTHFAIEDIDQVQRIFMVDRTGKQALVERIEGLKWTYTNKVSGKQYLANSNAVFSLLETLKKVRVREPVGKPAINNAVKSIAMESTKVEIYGKNKKILKVYYVGAMTNGGTGNFMIMEGSETPYVSYIPNFQGTIGTRFITTEEDWRDKAVFRTDKESLEYVQVKYLAPSQKKESFRITKTSADKFEVTSPDPSVTPYDQSIVNNDNASTYFEDFDVLSAEKIIYNKKKRDSIISTTPFAIVSYKANYHNEAQTFRLYSVYNPDADRGDGMAGHRQKIQRYFIDIDEDNFFLGQHLVIRKILWGYTFFFQKDAVKLLEDEAMSKKSFPDNKEEIREERRKRKEEKAKENQ